MYYLQENGIKKGPFNKEELKKLNLMPNSLIWKQGSKKWYFASEESELEEYFLKLPPESETLLSSIKVKLSDRFWCFVLDAILYEISAIIICLFIFSELDIDILLSSNTLILLLVILFLLIRIFLESMFVYFYGKSFFQGLAKIKVCDSEGKKISFSMVVLRTFVKNIVAGIPTSVFYFLSDADFLHERLTDTQVKYSKL